MSKLSKENKFIDISDYGRPIAKIGAQLLKETAVTPIHVTLIFGICGIVAIYSILQHWYPIGSPISYLKSIIDGIDGELARVKKTPSYTGRYLDSVFDILLNAGFLIAIGYTTTGIVFG
jgi:phosphatidylglycerophosphate synthase